MDSAASQRPRNSQEPGASSILAALRDRDLLTHAEQNLGITLCSGFIPHSPTNWNALNSFPVLGSAGSVLEVTGRREPQVVSTRDPARDRSALSTCWIRGRRLVAAGAYAFQGIDFVLGTSGVDGIQWSAHPWGRLGEGFPMSPRSKGTSVNLGKRRGAPPADLLDARR